jgi:hypothetical protein
MPTHDRVGLHDDQGCSPIPARLGEQHPKQAISRAEVRTPDGARQRGHLLTEREILERDRAVAAADQADRSQEHHQGRQHA